MTQGRAARVLTRVARMFWSNHFQSANSYAKSSAAWHNGTARAATRGTVPPLVLQHEVPSLRARKTSATATARADHAADRCARVLGPASRARAGTLPNDRAADARRFRSAALVLRTAVGDAVLSGGNVSRRECRHPGVPVL